MFTARAQVLRLLKHTGRSAFWAAVDRRSVLDTVGHTACGLELAEIGAVLAPLLVTGHYSLFLNSLPSLAVDRLAAFLAHCLLWLWHLAQNLALYKKSGHLASKLDPTYRSGDPPVVAPASALTAPGPSVVFGL
jgi:hypothetical protein